MDEKKRKVIIILSLVILLCSPIFLTIIILSKFIGWVYSIALAFFSIVLVVQKITTFLIFPASFKFYRKNIEGNNRSDMAYSYSYRIKELKLILKSVLVHGEDKNGVSEIQPASKYQKQSLIGILRNLSNLYEVYDQFMQANQNNCSKAQKQLFNCLENFINKLDSVYVHAIDEKQQSFTQVTVLSLQNVKFYAAKLEDYSQWDSLYQTINDLEAVLDNSHVNQLTKKQKLMRWYGDNSLGNLDLMRQFLISESNGQQIWIDGKDKVKIDCFFIPSSKKSKKAVLLCNPNAAYYEFFSVNSDIIVFYLSRGINIFTFNYRGYGRTKGAPNLGKIKQDAEEVLQYMVNNLQQEKIIVHGESLGGSVAAHLASTSSFVNFLFLDKTFSSLENIAKNDFGQWARCAIRMFISDSDVVKDYLNSKCYKLIAQDPNDTIIHDISSLKTGIALKLCYQQEMFMSPQEQQMTIKILQELHHSFLAYKKQESNERKLQISTNESQKEVIDNIQDYQLVVQEDDKKYVKSFVIKMHKIIHSIDAAGVTFAHVSKIKELKA